MKSYNQEFRNSKTLLQRIEHSQEILSKYTDRVPVIIEPQKGIKLQKCKYLVPKEITLLQLFMSIRKNIDEINEKEAIFIFTETNFSPRLSDSLATLYNLHKNADGFLYIRFIKEETFGGVS